MFISSWMNAWKEPGGRREAGARVSGSSGLGVAQGLYPRTPLSEDPRATEASWLQGSLNGLSVDVEEAFHASAFEEEQPPERWSGLEQRAEPHTRRLLELFGRHDVKGTFFVLGWVAERQPSLVKEIAAAGHEVACHGYAHRRVYHQSPEVFRDDIRRSRAILQDLSGQPVWGYRAPTYSITKASLWALDELLDAGFRYDSSIFPVRHDRYGIPSAPRFPYRIKRPKGMLVEIPPTSVRLAGQNLPVAGGGYLRLYPLAVTELALSIVNRVEHHPAFVYVHPWEVDAEQPRLTQNALKWWRHSVAIDQVSSKLNRLLRRHRFGPFQEVVPLGGPFEAALPILDLEARP